MNIFWLFSVLFIMLLPLDSVAYSETRELDTKESYSTTMDFESTMIDGKMKAPNGFLLQGRNRQSLSNMVKLRSNFNNKLKDSRSAVKALVK